MLGEYDAGYENCIDSLIREIEKLQDENDKLSEQISSLVGRSFRMADKMSCIEAEKVELQDELEFANNQCEMAVLELLDQQGQLEADNAKLRELVRDMCAWAYIDSSCDLQERFADRMRELGVDA